eukprot:845328-Amorphochlora_amoeboformis.AAC.3
MLYHKLQFLAILYQLGVEFAANLNVLQVFDDLSKLEILSLAGNSLKVLPSDLLKGCKSLREVKGTRSCILRTLFEYKPFWCPVHMMYPYRS